MFKKIKGTLKDVVIPTISEPKRRAMYNRLVTEGLPAEIHSALDFLISGKLDVEAEKVSNNVEKIRKEVASGGNNYLEVLYSPKPGNSGLDATPDLRPQPGKKLEFTMEQVANIGKNRRWGIVLYLIARAAQSEKILELGACAGISGCYLASSPHCRKLTTVEGSQALANLAQKNLANVTDHSEVMNLLFDDALDILFANEQIFDFVFIDGHHEKIATIHYWQRISENLSNNAIVIFDDISWSYDMREAWKYLSIQNSFSHSIDFGTIGVCIYHGERNDTRYWDLQPLLGKHPIGDPQGWKR
jgi:predicted O-methyltransferase YrrM